MPQSPADQLLNDLGFNDVEREIVIEASTNSQFDQSRIKAISELVLAKSIRNAAERVTDSNEKLSRSNEKYSDRMVKLTKALVFVGCVQAVVAVVQIIPLIVQAVQLIRAWL